MRKLVHFPSLTRRWIELINNAMNEPSISVFNATLEILKSLDCLFGFIEQLVQFASRFFHNGLEVNKRQCVSGKSALFVIETTTKFIPRRLEIGRIRLDTSQHVSC